MAPLWRTRRKPGPLLSITLAILAVTGTALRAHDPGLSSLDVKVSDSTVSVWLSIAASDVVLIAPDGDVRLTLIELARDAVRMSVDGETVSLVIGQVLIEDRSARVQLSYAMADLRDRPRRLEISSDVPGRIARGHRELVIVSEKDRVVAERLLDAGSGPVAIDLEAAAPSAARTAWHFLGLGVHHILSGYDHLVFLAGLLLVGRTVRNLVGPLTAFTVAHSVSLALVTIGGVHAPASIVEPLIAASIVWVGLDVLWQGRHGRRWLVVFGFGLIHGFGFAGALMELGFGSSATQIALALLSFNTGVEVGQLAAAAAMLPLVWLMRSQLVWQARLVPVCSAMIVMAGGYWLIERLQ